MATKKLVVISDTQAPYHLPQAISLACAFIKDYKPDTFVLNGDIIDAVSMSTFSKTGRLSPRTALQEIALTMTGVIIPCLEALGAKVKWDLEELEHPVFGDSTPVIRIQEVVWSRKVDVFFVEGNHENRFARYVSTFAPALDGLVDFEEVLQLKKLGIKFIKGRGTSGNGVLRLIPALAITHGEYTGPNAAMRTLMACGCSVIAGHGHGEQTKRHRFSLTGIDWVGLISGCLCKDGEWKAFSAYNRGFVAGWYNEEKNEFGVDHVRISGKNHNEIFSAFGNYVAEERGSKWVVRSGEEVEGRSLSSVGGEGVRAPKSSGSGKVQKVKGRKVKKGPGAGKSRSAGKPKATGHR